MNIGIYIYDNAEVLDFSGPFEVFSVASRFLDEKEKFNVFLISEKSPTVTARGNYKINSHYTFENVPQTDVLIVVGGVHTEEVKKTTVINWIKEQSKNTKIVASVCTGAFLLAEAKIITNHTVTTHWEDIPDLKNDYPTLDVVEDVRWVDEENIITSAGISAGIDMSLHLVSKIKNLELANKTAKQMQFDWIKS
ncbi:ThiJ/PfpI domain protein [Arcobacter nitrofigilis DSM 7299]|uniref:ThiJ/PfpI domain protein n=1 Tax=Arcobacter nitrofigilis (strain ATCC 33309 / DSM 7299 / CCUG 15893 / LMG 7604 / NCTC 12251 / CI) TaxID=572480 RepID=D5V0M4_ARCNC|nr:DJ-1/PfpI family protein [Arcobacter nitrofigilis]ADG93836.1 ThiJ/PfpI domain protein [Arcobacter nitrofigilis DSM 7299]